MMKLKRITAAAVAAVMLALMMPATKSVAETIDDTTSIKGWRYISIDTDSEGYVDIGEGVKGKGSAKFVNRTPKTANEAVRFETSVSVKKGVKYCLEFDAKAENASYIWNYFSWANQTTLTPYSKTYDWTTFRRSYTPANDELLWLRFVIEGKCDGFWLDNVKFYDTNNPSVNLVSNGDFEDIKGSVTNSGVSDTSDIQEEPHQTEALAAVFHTVTVDGKGDDWEGIDLLPITRKQEMNAVAAEQISAGVRLAYDDKNLYCLFEVEDNTHVVAPDGQYWNGDSVQIGIARNTSTQADLAERGISYHEDTGIVYMAGGTVEAGDTFDAKVSKNGSKLLYEVAIPWTGYFGGEVPDSMKFNALVNNNDGAGRAYCMEITPGISLTKNSGDFNFLMLWKNLGNVLQCIDYPKDLLSGSTGFVNVNLLNNGKTAEEVTVSSAFAEFEEQVTVAAGQSRVVEIPVRSDAVESFDVDVTLKAGDEEFTTTRTIPISHPPYDYAKYLTLQKTVQGYVDEIKELILKCNNKGISTDYENAALALFVKHQEVMGMLERKNDYDLFNEFEIEITKKYLEVKENLLAYLNGTKKSLSVPKYITDDLKIDGTAVLADTVNGNVKEERPVFFVGYGVFETVADEIPFYSTIGINTIHFDSNVQNALTPKSDLKYWRTISAGNSTASFSISSEEKAGGKYSMKVTNTDAYADNKYTMVTVPVVLEPNESYEWGFKAKASGIADHNSCWMNVNGLTMPTRRSIENSADWQQYVYEYNTDDTKTTFNFVINSSNKCGTVYIDDVFLKKKGSDVNLISNGDFEDRYPTYEEMTDLEKEADDMGWAINYAELDRIEKALQKAEQNNVQVDITLSTHYLPEFILKSEPDIATPGNSPYHTFDLTHPIPRKAASIWARLIAETTRKYKSAGSICITNEPAIRGHLTDVYDDEWTVHLYQKYGTIDALNLKWNTDYKSFEEVTKPMDVEATPLYYEHKDFQDGILTDWHNFLVQEVKRENPDILTYAKVMDSFHYAYKEYYRHVPDYEEIAPLVDINGCDAFSYMKNNDYQMQHKMGWYDYQTSVKDAPVWDSESHIFHDKYEVTYDAIMPYYAAADVWNGAVHGRGAMHIWLWDFRPTAFKGDRTSMGLSYGTNFALRPGEAFAVSEAALDLNRLSKEVTAIQKEDAKVGLLYSRVGLGYNKNYMNTLGKAYENIIFNGQKVGFVTDSKPQDMHKYEILVIPEVTHIRSDMIAEIKAYLENGGKVLMLYDDCIRFDEYNNPQDVAVVDYIYQKADRNSSIAEKIDEMELSEVTLIDTETGRTVENVEWAYAEYDGDIVVNAIFYDNASYNPMSGKQVKLLYCGKEVESFTELRSMEEMKNTVNIKAYQPVLLRFEK